MKKVMGIAVVFAGFLAISAQAAETAYTWKAKALDKQLGTPIEGVKFSWKFNDKISGKSSEDECTTNSEGICEVKVMGEKSFFSGSHVRGEATFTKEGFEKIGDIQWMGNEDVNKFVVVKLTNIALVQAEIDEKAKRLAREKAERQELLSQLEEAEKAASAECATKVLCDKLFALTEIYVAKSSDMKIQMVTATTIETHNPIEQYKLGMSAYRLPGEGNASIVKIETRCKDDGILQGNTLCLTKQLGVAKGFKPFVAALLKK